MLTKKQQVEEIVITSDTSYVITLSVWRLQISSSRQILAKIFCTLVICRQLGPYYKRICYLPSLAPLMRRDKHAICVLETNCNKTEVTEYTGTITFKSNLQYGHIFIPNRGLTKQN